MKYAIITGTSKGLGASIAEQMLQEGIHVIGIARHQNKKLEQFAKQAGVSYQHMKCDLADVDQIDKTFETISDQIFKKNTDLVYLINNAATVNPIETSANHTIEAVQAHMQINLIAPMITSSLILKRAEKLPVRVVIVNVSSGAADRATYGWSAYGASKAGLNSYTTTVALEQTELGTYNKVILFDPSIMDTAMQGDIRLATKEAFQEVDQFKQFKEESMLRDTAVVAKALVDILGSEAEVTNGKYYSVKDLL